MEKNIDYIAEIAAKHGIEINDHDFADSPSLLIGFYSCDLIERIYSSSKKKLKQDVPFIEELLLIDDKDIRSSLDYDLLVNLRDEVTDISLLAKFLEKSEAISAAYAKAITIKVDKSQDSDSLMPS